MRKVSVTISLSLDGVMQAPGRPDEDFAGYWPHQKDNPFTEVLDNLRKYVGSRTLTYSCPGRTPRCSRAMRRTP